MEWQLSLILIIGGLIVIMATGMPVAFAFMFINVIAAYFLWGGGIGLSQLTLSIYASVSSFVWLPVPLFILMGELMFRSGIAANMIEAMEKWLGRLPGRLGVLTVIVGTIIGALTGSVAASTALLGDVLMPEMVRRGYKKPMTLGPIIGSAGLAPLIPPSIFAVVVAALLDISVAKLLIGGIGPGLVSAGLYIFYIIVRCWLNPSLAPSYDVATMTLTHKLKDTIKYVLPLGFVVFAVSGVMLLGIATPSEAAATGALSCILLACVYGRVNWQMLKQSLSQTLNITLMLFMIISSSIAFSQILAFSGASRGLTEYVMSLPLPPITLIIASQALLFFLGTFMGSISMIMITAPIFLPVVNAVGFNPLLFGLMTVFNMVIAEKSPPFGMILFVLKGVASPDVTMGDIFRESVPYLFLDCIVLIIMFSFPALMLWLPNVMG